VGAERDPAIDALSGLGDSAANLVEISGVINVRCIKGLRLHRTRQWSADVLLHVTVLRRDAIKPLRSARLVVECCSARKATRRSDPLDGRVDGDSSGKCCRHGPMSAHANQRSGAGAGQMFNRLRGFGF